MNKRSLNIDLLKCLATFLVVLVHFFLHTHYYDQPFSGKSILIGSVIWLFAMTCTPLFITITGFLMSRKTYNKKYFLHLIQILKLYVGAALLYTFVDKPAINLEFFLLTIKNILGYSHYAWYVNLYIGLYLMIPLLNTAYQSLNTKYYKLIFLLVLSSLTIMPDTIGLFRNLPLTPYINIVPNYWNFLWPLTYYFIGSFLREYPIKIKIRWLILAMLTVNIASITLFVKLFEKTIALSYNNLSVFLLVIGICLLFLQREVYLPKSLQHIEKIIQFISSNTLLIYLLSVIGDSFWYPFIHQNSPDFSYILPKLPIAVPLLFLQAVLLTFLYRILPKISKKLVK